MVLTPVVLISICSVSGLAQQRLSLARFVHGFRRSCSQAVCSAAIINVCKRDENVLRDLPNGVTRGQVRQKTTIRVKITNIQAYCCP